jgi:hypothetical protein
MTASERRNWIEINRAPVLTLWAAVVAERLGFKRDEALTLGRAVAGLNAYAKGKSLGIFRPSKEKVAEKRKGLTAGTTIQVDLLNRAVPAMRCKEGLRAVSKGRPISPAGVEKYLEGKFGCALDETRRAMADLAKAYSPGALSACAYQLYESFRPEVAAGTKGWGAKGRLSLTKIGRLVDRSR